MHKIKVLIVDDSAIVRQTLMEILNEDPFLVVVAVAADPYAAAKQIEKHHPDVMLLDVEMPRMDGLTFLEKLMLQHPMPVVMCSSLTAAGSKLALSALEKGAVDIIEKPRLGAKQFLQDSKLRLCDVVKSAAVSKLRHLPLPGMNKSFLQKYQTRSPGLSNHEAILSQETDNTRENFVPPKYPPDVILPKPTGRVTEATEKIIVVGASTGGTEAVRIFLEAMPVDCPGILVVQHMPKHFTATFAQRLNSTCAITVKEAVNQDSVLPGQALIAPGNLHMLLKRSASRYFVELHDGPLVTRHRPSVNVLFRSAASYAGKNAIGVILTGMGDDGTIGMKELHEQGAINFAQDEDSCVVFGMPFEAIKAGAVHHTLPLTDLAPALINLTKQTR